MPQRAVSVSEVNEYVRQALESDTLLSRLLIAGEVSGLKRYPSGHVYFTLKDEGAQIRCALFAQYAHHHRTLPQNGDHVHVLGRVSLFPRDGQFQMYAQHIETAGEGALFLQLEALKQRLLQEGLFSPERKKPLPQLAKKIAVVTSPAGAALHDILSVARRRSGLVSLLLVPVPVQGLEAPVKIAEGLAKADASGADLIILARGGGSSEDLSAFNTEEVARAVAACRLPVLSAVGHETDYTLADFTADQRAPTPSAAAEQAVYPAAELQEYLRQAALRMRRACGGLIAQKQAQTAALSYRLSGVNPVKTLQAQRDSLQVWQARYQKAIRRQISRNREGVTALAARLEALSPLRVLSRGYAVALRENGMALRAAAEAAPGESLRLLLHRGELRVTVQGGNETEKMQ